MRVSLLGWPCAEMQGGVHTAQQPHSWSQAVGNSWWGRDCVVCHMLGMHTRACLLGSVFPRRCIFRLNAHTHARVPTQPSDGQVAGPAGLWISEPQLLGRWLLLSPLEPWQIDFRGELC